MDARRRGARDAGRAGEWHAGGRRDPARPRARRMPARSARLCAKQQAQHAPFILTAEYRYWKQIIKKELGPIAGIMQRKVGLVGSLPIVVRFIKSAEALVDAATRVPTRFLDDGSC